MGSITSWALDKHGITVAEVHRNASPAFLYEAALKFEKGSAISSTGAPERCAVAGTAVARA